jgi:hypothetical protein
MFLNSDDMKKLCFFLIFIGFSFSIHAQRNEKIYDKSQTKQLIFGKEGLPGKDFDPSEIPDLVISDIEFIDENQNNLIDADENTFLKFNLKNIGKGIAEEVKINVVNSANFIRGLDIRTEESTYNIKPGDKLELKVPVIGKMNLENGKSTFEIKAEEKYGWNSNPVKINIETREFRDPKIIVTSGIFKTEKGIIKRNYPVELTILIQNVGDGEAKKINIRMFLDDKNLRTLGKDSYEFERLGRGEFKELNFKFTATNDYPVDTIPVVIELIEKYKKYGDDTIFYAIINEKGGTNVTDISPVLSDVQHIEIKYLWSDVDINIPVDTIRHQNRFALIIGNEDYSSNQVGLIKEQDVPYAINDARIFREYAIKTMGIPERQIKYIENGTLGQINQGLGWLEELAKLKQGEAELYFYYSGHGLPDQETYEPYIIPVDINASTIKSAIKLSDIYNRLTVNSCKKVSVFLDACFSGGAREKPLDLTLKGIKVRPKDYSLHGNMVIFSSSTGDQPSHVISDKQHGLFTYFLLKKIKETKGNINYKELYDYLNSTLPVEAVLLDKSAQTPNINVSPAIKNAWQEWSFK